MSRVCIIGLDCLTPQLLFNQHLKYLPNFENLVKNSVWGPLKSTIPPITIPAWASMVTGSPPGQLGSYGFRTRKNHSYSDRKLPSSLGITIPTLWELASKAGLFSRVLTVPQTYPALPLHGELIAGFPIVNENGPVSHPRQLISSIRGKFPQFQVDIQDYRNKEPHQVLAEIHQMTNARFEVAKHWLELPDWSLFMMVEMGPDRLHHVFWEYMEQEHPLQFAVRDYYILLDNWLGKILKQIKSDDLLLVVSDHGAQTMQGGFAINQWLIDHDYLHLMPEHPRTGPLNPDQIDWGKTKAWADGGYVGRVYFNLIGRESQGLISQDDAHLLSRELKAKWSSIRTPSHEQLKFTVLDSVQAYGKSPKGVPPDLTILINDLAYRCLGTLGHSGWLSAENDTGRDGANHAQDGIFICRSPSHQQGVQRPQEIFDIAPTVLNYLKLPIPDHMIGTAIP